MLLKVAQYDAVDSYQPNVAAHDEQHGRRVCRGAARRPLAVVLVAAVLLQPTTDADGAAEDGPCDGAELLREVENGANWVVLHAVGAFRVPRALLQPPQLLLDLGYQSRESLAGRGSVTAPADTTGRGM